MLYCVQCRELMESPCPIRRHATREPRPDDQVLLFKGDSIQTGILASMLTDAHLPFLREGRLGAGLATWAGEMLEYYSVYVPCALYEKAGELAMVLQSAPSVPAEEGPEEYPEEEED